MNSAGKGTGKGPHRVSEKNSNNHDPHKNLLL